ncbi:MAG: sirohydrochlorin chelatase [Candidatus Nanopelagicales bacterium]
MTALILIAHGSPDPRAAWCTRELAARVQNLWPIGPVVAAFIEHDEPRLDDAVGRLVDDGEDDIIVVPLLLSRAFHGRVDVPKAVAAVRASSTAVIRCAEVIGADKALLPALERSLPGAAPVVLAVAGTADAAAQRDLDGLAAAWSRQRGTAVVVAHASQATPDVATAIKDLERAQDAQGAHSAKGTQAAVASFVLFEGILPDRIRAAAGPRHVTPALFTSPEIADLIIDRALAARSPVVSR